VIVDLFAGPGGWDEGIKDFYVDPVVGLEIDKAACNTRAAAGHLTIQTDVATYPLEPFFGKVDGLIASPPCQAFSAAGRRGGLNDLRGQLIYEVIRWADGLRPKWIACEQVKEVLPIWKLFADEMRSWGYHVWYGRLNAADYGVPQTRVRAILMASQEPFTAPEPTHAADPHTDIFGDGREPWVTMAQALGWDGTDGLLPPAGSRIRGGLPTKHHRPTERDLDEPAPTLAFGNDAAGWAWERPATTVVGSFQPQIIAAPGWRTDPKVPRQTAEGSIAVSIRQAGVLQTFPHDYPWWGSKTKMFEQCGNAIPPLLARHIVSQLWKANHL
jgi:DNA (cytosine-5)-methyltransferase 1